jgi:glycyl-tRNA synthetase beta chain
MTQDTARETLLVELGTEELPPKALKSLGLAFRDGIVAGLGERELASGAVHWFASPRRLAVLVEQVQLQGADKAVEVLGPPADRARDAAGEWSPAALGFARKQGIDPDQLQVVDTPKGARLAWRSTAAGVRLADELVAVVNAAIGELPIPKRMRWGATRQEFVRPVHWVVLMLGSDVVPGPVLGLTAGRVTRGHRFHHPAPISLDAPEDYADALLKARVVADFEIRRERIRQQVVAQAGKLGAKAVIDDDLLDEVAGLVEWPVALTGSFEQRFLAVPADALVSSMREHQKYFHLVDGEGRLQPHFITVSNIESADPTQVIDGNERVIRPRLSDAAFFFETDKKVSLADRVPQLEAVVFQKELGTLLDKSERVEKLAARLAPLIGSDIELSARAGRLSKTDLISEMVGEFADMQGIAGYYYALNDGEDPAVATAIEQQYLPRFAGDRLPDQPVATTVALADRLDTLVGIFGIGQPPTGSRDPFGLRRASLAVLRILVEGGLDLDLRECLEWAAQSYPVGVITDGATETTLEYMLERFRAWFEEEQIPVEVFRAVAARGLTRPLDIQRRVHAVYQFSQQPEAAALAAANKRVSNILEKLDEGHQFGAIDPQLLQLDAEQSLAAALGGQASDVTTRVNEGDYAGALGRLAALRTPVDRFFDDVMVMDENLALRANRLNTLKALRDLFLQVADISHLVVTR